MKTVALERLSAALVNMANAHGPCYREVKNVWIGDIVFEEMADTILEEII